MNFPFRPPPMGQRPRHGRRHAHPSRRGWTLLGLHLPRPHVGSAFRSFGRTLAAHRGRTLGLGLLGLALTVLVATTSLPLALAPSLPNLALFFSPENPYALMQLAREQRRQMNVLLQPAPDTAEQAAASAEQAAAPAGGAGQDPSTSREQPPPAAGSGSDAPTVMVPSQSGNGEAASASAPLDSTAPDVAPAINGNVQPSSEDAATAAAPEASDPSRDEQIQSLRASIKDLAGRTLEHAPLNAAAYQLLGEMGEDTDAVRQAMTAAFARSRRQAVATFWLMNQSYEERNFADVVSKADNLIRTTAALNKYTFSYLYSLASDPDGRRALVAELQKDPPWRAAFFRTLGQSVVNTDALDLFLAMKEAGSPVREAELAPYLYQRLFVGRDAEGTYNTWLQLLPEEQLTKLLPINNPDFATDPSGIPFDWRINPGRNVSVRLVHLPRTQDARAIRIQFGVGRVRFGGVLQVTVLRPGPYSFEAREAGNMSAQRGMKWQVVCFPGNTLAGESSQLFGSPRGWQDFSFQFTVPEQPDCITQVVRLIHNARSVSEEYATGDISFSQIRIKKLNPDQVINN